MDLNVMMVGFTSAGKTSYMGAMYRLFNTGKLRGGFWRDFFSSGTGSFLGFAIEAQDMDSHKSLLKIGEKVSRGKYPDPTDVRDEYLFDLKYNCAPILKFNWEDYRGGVLSERGNEEMRSVVNKIIKADALIVFLDVTRFGSDDSTIEMINRVSTLLQNSLARRERPLVVSIVLTKADNVRCFDIIKKTTPWKKLSMLENLLSKNGKVSGMTCMTAVGKKFENVEYPFLHSMSMGVLLKIKQLERERDTAMREAERLKNEGGFWDDFVTALKNEWDDGNRKSKRDLAKEERTKAERVLAEINRLENPLNEIRKLVENASKSAKLYVKVFSRTK